MTLDAESNKRKNEKSGTSIAFLIFHPNSGSILVNSNFSLQN